MDKQVTLYRLNKFTRGVLVLIAIFLGILVFKPLLRTERVYVANFPRQQSVYVDGIRQNRTNPFYVEIVESIDVEGRIDINDYPPIRVQVTNFP